MAYANGINVKKEDFSVASYFLYEKLVAIPTSCGSRVALKWNSVLCKLLTVYVIIILKQFLYTGTVKYKLIQEVELLLKIVCSF